MLVAVKIVSKNRQTVLRKERNFVNVSIINYCLGGKGPNRASVTDQERKELEESGKQRLTVTRVGLRSGIFANLSLSNGQWLVCL